jgi:hypothetical protein
MRRHFPIMAADVMALSAAQQKRERKAAKLRQVVASGGAVGE